MKLIFKLFLVELVGLALVCAMPGPGLHRAQISGPGAAAAQLAARRSQEVARAPLTIAEVIAYFLRMTRNWFSELILNLLGITASELIKQINYTMVGMDNLVEEAVEQLEKIMRKVGDDVKPELEAILTHALARSLEIMEPILDQLKQIIPNLPPSPAAGAVSVREPGTMDFVSDLIEAILGISLEELITNINHVFIESDKLLTETFLALSEVAKKVSVEIAAELELIIDDIVIKAQELVRPLLVTLGQLPIVYNEPPKKPLIAGPIII